MSNRFFKALPNFQRMIGALISHPYLFILVMFLLGIVSYLLFELRSSTTSPNATDRSHATRMLFGSVIIIIGLLLYYSSLIDGVANRVQNSGEESQSLSKLKDRCADPTVTSTILGASPETGCRAVTYLVYFMYIIIILGLLSLILSLVEVGKNI